MIPKDKVITNGKDFIAEKVPLSLSNDLLLANKHGEDVCNPNISCEMES